MKDSRIRYFAANMERLSRRDRVFINNPVIMQGLGLAPIVIAATTIQSAVMLALATAILLTPTRIIAAALSRRLSLTVRAIIYAVASGAVYFAVAWIMDILFANQTLQVGTYLPLMVLEPLVIKRYENPRRERITTSFRKGIITTIGFCLVLLLVAALREMLAFGTVGGIVMFRGPAWPMASMPAGGFILLGFIAAVWRGTVAAFKRNVGKGAKKLQ